MDFLTIACLVLFAFFAAFMYLCATEKPNEWHPENEKLTDDEIQYANTQTK